MIPCTHQFHFNRQFPTRLGLAQIICCVLLLTAGDIQDAQAEEFRVQNWRVEDGLPDGQITIIKQTLDGYLWIGTPKGLARFDGQRFKIFKAGDTSGFTDSRISSLATDCAGNLWVGMLDGNIARLTENGFTAMQPAVPLALRPEQKLIPDTWLWDRRMAMIEEAENTAYDSEHFHDHFAQLTVDGEGSIWWNVSGLDLMRFRSGRWTVLNSMNGMLPSTIRKVACDHEGQVWLESDGKLERFQSSEQTNSSSSAVTLSGRWAVMAPANQGGMWVAEPRSSWLQHGGPVLRLSDGCWHHEVSLAPPSPPPASSVVTCLLEDRTHRLWCGTTSGGVFFSNSQGMWQRLHSQNSFSQGYITCLFEDRQGNIWVGTVGDGLYRVTLQQTTRLNLPAPYENAEINTTCVRRDGSIWMGTGGSGAIRFDGIHFTHFGIQEGLTNLHVCTLFEDSKTNFWAGTSGGLFHWEAGRFVRVDGPPEMSVWVKMLFEDRRGRLWIGTINGLICYEMGRFEVFYLRSDHGYCDIRAMAENSSGDLWIGTIGQGLFQIPNGQADKLQRLEAFPATDARALYFSPANVLWIGGWGSGLFQLKDGNILNVTTEDGMPSDRIQSILSDNTGQLWMSTDNGVVGVRPQEIQNYRRGKSPPLICEHISLHEGLANGGCSGSGQPVSVQTSDGRLWFPNYEGVAVLAPHKSPSIQPPFKVMIETVIADGKELMPATTNKWKASSGVHRFEFDYAAPNFNSQPKAHFQHKLDGMDDDWVDGGEQHAAYYSQLPPGNYQFHVRVGGNNNKWLAADKVIQLQVMPRLWEQRWLQILIISLLMAILVGGLGWSQRRKYRLRLERLQMQNAMENERRRIARDLHDEFGSSLTGIALQGEATSIGGNIPPPAIAEIVSMTSRVRQLIGKLDEVVWATDPANDSLSNFVSFLCDHAEHFLSPTTIKCRLESPRISELPIVVLDALTRHNVLLAAKEAINNVVRHSGAQTMCLTIRLETNSLIIEIADNGQGHDLTKTPNGGIGLTNIRTRMELIKGHAKIRSLVGNGTVITLIIPLPKTTRPSNRDNPNEY